MCNPFSLQITLVSYKACIVTNGTRQGYLLSPTWFFCVPGWASWTAQNAGSWVSCWGLLVWSGAVCYADDLILLALSRTAAAMMLDYWEKYAEEHNLKFWTNLLPHKSKSKCIYLCGKLAKPHTLTQLANDLPWVANADHLGHVLDQFGSYSQKSEVNWENRWSSWIIVLCLQYEHYRCMPVMTLAPCSMTSPAPHVNHYSTAGTPA